MHILVGTILASAGIRSENDRAGRGDIDVGGNGLDEGLQILSVNALLKAWLKQAAIKSCDREAWKTQNDL